MGRTEGRTLKITLFGIIKFVIIMPQKRKRKCFHCFVTLTDLFLFSLHLCSSPMLLPLRPWLHPAPEPQEEEVEEVEEEVREEG